MCEIVTILVNDLNLLGHKLTFFLAVVRILQAVNKALSKRRRANRHVNLKAI